MFGSTYSVEQFYAMQRRQPNSSQRTRRTYMDIFMMTSNGTWIKAEHNWHSPLTVMKCGFPSDISLDSCVCTNATCAVICCELELFGEDATELAGKMVDTVIGASSGESVWSIGTTSMIETPSDVVPVWSMNFFYRSPAHRREQTSKSTIIIRANQGSII